MTWFSRTCGFEQAQHVVCLCFFWHNPDTNALVPPLIMPVYRFFLHTYLPCSVNNMWLNFYTKLVGCGYAMTWMSWTHHNGLGAYINLLGLFSPWKVVFEVPGNGITRRRWWTGHPVPKTSLTVRLSILKYIGIFDTHLLACHTRILSSDGTTRVGT